MPCKECGGHGGHHKPSCAFSPAVLQITNKDCTIFHRVEIPAAMGDETTVPPANGKYRNVLLTYEASGNAYLYSSDGIPTKLTFATSDYDALENKPAINGVTLEGNKTTEDLGIETGGGDDTIRLHINWDDPNIDKIRRESIIAVWTPPEEIDQWSLLLDEDNNKYSPYSLFDDLKSGKHIIIEDFIVGGVYNTQTGTWDKGLATTVEVVARSSEVQIDIARAIFFYVVAPINPLASEFGYTPHDSSNWGPVTTCLVYIEEKGSRTTAVVSVDGFGYYEQTA